eukprot:9346001-Pyramimonas_sp.AAC.1
MPAVGGVSDGTGLLDMMDLLIVNYALSQLAASPWRPVYQLYERGLDGMLGGQGTMRRRRPVQQKCGQHVINQSVRPPLLEPWLPIYAMQWVPG